LSGQSVLAIDYGEKRIGLAASDPMGIIATGIGTIENTPDLIERLNTIVTERGIARIVVGLPLTLQGVDGDTTRLVRAFVEKLSARVGVPVALLDERFTSSIATQTIRDMGVGRKKRRDKGKVDEIAAIILLQDYLSRV
jgi:putative Holliday junction resolvase